jgi:hypothetical protein
MPIFASFFKAGFGEGTIAYCIAYAMLTIADVGLADIVKAGTRVLAELDVMVGWARVSGMGGGINALGRDE